MAMMPHPERTKNGDVIFSSMKETIKNTLPSKNYTLSFERPHYEVAPYESNGNSTEWIIDMIITDNEAASVHNALDHLGYNVSISRQTHWEIKTHGDRKSVLQKIDESGELYNSNKEFISKAIAKENTTSFLVRQKEDMIGRSKLETLTRRLEIGGIAKLSRGVIWNVTVNSGNLNDVLSGVLNTHLFFNPLSHDCYRIN